MDEQEDSLLYEQRTSFLLYFITCYISRGDCPLVALRSNDMTVGGSKTGFPVDDFCKLVRLMDTRGSQNLSCVPESESCL